MEDLIGVYGILDRDQYIPFSELEMDEYSRLRLESGYVRCPQPA